MSKTERVANLQNKAQELINWFNGRVLPNDPVKPKPGVVIMNPLLFYTYQLSIITGYWENPYCRPFVAAYKNLETLKSIIIDTGNK